MISTNAPNMDRVFASGRPQHASIHQVHITVTANWVSDMTEVATTAWTSTSAENILISASRNASILLDPINAPVIKDIVPSMSIDVKTLTSVTREKSLIPLLSADSLQPKEDRNCVRVTVRILLGLIIAHVLMDTGCNMTIIVLVCVYDTHKQFLLDLNLKVVVWIPHYFLIHYLII